jgi:hypothetical protein
MTEQQWIEARADKAKVVATALPQTTERTDAAALAVMSVESVKFPGRGSGDERRIAVADKRVCERTLIGGVDVEHGNSILGPGIKTQRRSRSGICVQSRLRLKRRTAAGFSQAVVCQASMEPSQYCARRKSVATSQTTRTNY